MNKTFGAFLAALVLVVAGVLTYASIYFGGARTEIAAKDDATFGIAVRNYLLNNPEILSEVQQALEKKQVEAREAQAKAAVVENREAIFNAPYDLALGNPNGKTTIVEFFDYNCGYCRRAVADMDAIIKANPDVRFVLKEFPILGQDSVDAHRVSAAIRLVAPEKYADFHRALMSGENANEARAIEVAVSLGLDEAAIRAKMAESPNDESVRDAYQLASKIGITGTPSYIIGDEAVFGAVGEEELTRRINNMQQCGKTACS